MMLLHVIEAACPVDLPFNLTRLEGASERMPDDVPVRLDVGHEGRSRSLLQGAVVGGLPAAFGVKRAAVERHDRSVSGGAALDDAGAERSEVGISEVQSFRGAHAPECIT